MSSNRPMSFPPRVQVPSWGSLLTLLGIALILASLAGQGGGSTSFAQSPQSPLARPGGAGPFPPAGALPGPLLPNPAVPWLVAGAILLALLGGTFLARSVAAPAPHPDRDDR